MLVFAPVCFTHLNNLNGVLEPGPLTPKACHRALTGTSHNLGPVLFLPHVGGSCLWCGLGRLGPFSVVSKSTHKNHPITHTKLLLLAYFLAVYLSAVCLLSAICFLFSCLFTFNAKNPGISIVI